MKPPDRGRLAARDRLQRLAALHRRRRVGTVRDPPLDHRERLARGGGRASRPALLQHWYLHLCLGRHEPKEPERRGKVQLVDARELYVKMHKSLGEKRNRSRDDQIDEIVRLYGAFEESER